VESSRRTVRSRRRAAENAECREREPEFEKHAMEVPAEEVEGVSRFYRGGKKLDEFHLDFAPG
jgi:hypothetical protein